MNLKESYKKWRLRRSFYPYLRQKIYKAFALRISKGLSPMRSIRTYGEIYTSQKIKAGEHLLDISNNLEAGMSTSDAFKKYLPPSEFVIIAAGDKSQNLAGAFEDAAFLCEKQTVLIKAFKKSFRSFILKMLFVFGFLLGMSALASKILEVLTVPEESLPLYSLMLIAFSSHMLTYWPIYIVTIVLMIVFLIHRLPNGAGKFRTWLSYKVFPFTAYRSVTSTSFLIAFSSLMSNSKSTALKLIDDNAVPYLKHYTYPMFLGSSTGESDAMVFNVDLFEPFLRANLIDLIGLSNTEQDIRGLASHEMDQTIESFKKVDVTLNTLITLIMTISLFWAYLSYFIPVIEMVGSMRSGAF